MIQIIKVIVNLRSEEINMLKRRAAEIGVSVTEAMRTAIRTDYLLAQAEAHGADVLIERTDGTIHKLVWK